MIAALIGGKDPGQTVIDHAKLGEWDNVLKRMMYNMTGYDATNCVFKLSGSMLDVAFLTALTSELISAFGAPSADIGKLHLEL